MLYGKRAPYLYLALPLLLFGAFFFAPAILALFMSGLDYSRDLYQPDWVGLRNYARLVHSPDFWNTLSNTAVVVFGVVPAMVSLPILLAILVNKQLRGIQLFRVVLYVPVILSMVVVGIAWKWLYANDGLINYLLSLAGIPKIQWLVNPDIALVAVMVVIIWKGLAYYMMMYLAHLQSIPQELYQAAEVDGADTWRKHWHVTLPHLRPAIFLVALISTIGSLKVFPEIYVMTRGGPVGATRTLVYYIYQRAFEHLDLGLASAAGIVMMILLVGISALQMRLGGAEQ